MKIDSTQVRFFSNGGFNSQYKQLARYVKLQYQEELLDIVSRPMELTIMSSEDRAGRGGDHIPFRQDGYRSMRFTSAHEHGDASNGADYHDRQHTSEDILGVDTDGDMVLDSFFVDFNYLARNTVINGAGATMLAKGPREVDFTIETYPGPGIIIKITEGAGFANYRVGLRTTTNDWDEVYTIDGSVDTIFPPVAENYIVSVAAVDEVGIESLFSREIMFGDDELSLSEEEKVQQPFELLQNRPNPFDEATIIGVKLNALTPIKNAKIIIRNVEGKTIQTLPISLTAEVNEIVYHHGYGQVGTYYYTLIVDNKEVATKAMIFAN
jgi:hypothetical protein